MHARRRGDGARGQGHLVTVLGVFLGEAVVPRPGLQFGQMQDQERQVGLGALLDRLGILPGEQFPGPRQVVAAPQHVADDQARAHLHRDPAGPLPGRQGACGQVAADAVAGDELRDGLEGQYLRHQPLVTEPGGVAKRQVDLAGISS